MGNGQQHQYTPDVEQEGPSGGAAARSGGGRGNAVRSAAAGIEEVPKVARGGGSYTIVQGDSLWRIAERTYGSGRFWQEIMFANPGKVRRGGDLILVGDTLVLPVLQVPEATAPAAPGGVEGGTSRATQPRGICTEFGEFLVYPDDFEGELPTPPEGVRAVRESELTALEAAWRAAQVTGESTGPTSQVLDPSAHEDPTERARVDQFVSQDHTATNVALGGSGNFDLTYDPAAGTANIVVRIFFEFETGPVGGMLAAIFNDDEVADYYWSDEEKTAFQSTFVSQVHTVWSGQHSFRCEEPDGSLVNRPKWSELNASVNVNAVPVDDAANAHYSVEVQRIPVGEFEGSSVTAPSRDAAGAPTGAGSAQFDSNDVTGVHKGSSSPGTTQRAGVHEFGHMLGLQDEYPGPGRATGSVTRQGSTVGSGSNDDRIMAGGELVEQSHYASIQAALNQATSPIPFGFAGGST